MCPSVFAFTLVIDLQSLHDRRMLPDYSSYVKRVSPDFVDFDYVLNESSGASVDTFVETLGIHFVTRLD